LPAGASRQDVLSAIAGTTLAQTEIVGLFGH
jgi:hypothetical protein